MNIHLQLSQTQIEELSLLAQEYQSQIEDHKTPPFPKAATLFTLKEKLKAVLDQDEEFQKLLEHSQHQTEQLCLFHEKTEIRNLPWALATEERRLLSIAKAVAKEGKTELLLHQASVGFPLKVLVMVSSPEGVTRLDYEQEELKLLRAFSPLMSQGLAQVHFTDDGSLENLEEKLEENKYHILHFTGHGQYKDGQGILALEDPITGKLQETTGKKFNELLAKMADKGHRPDLVLLSACQTALGGAGDLTGVADTLIAGGVPAVIAMAASILDSCATVFAEKLYAQLSNEYSLPKAFQEACMAVKAYEVKNNDFAKSALAPAQWLIPQLLLNEQVEVLIDKSSERKELNFKNAAKIVSGQQALVDLKKRSKNYVFVGRRKEKREAMAQLKEGNSVLLRGQGGVGKTALAEHLAIRLLAGDPSYTVFTFSEKAPNAQSLLDQMKNYLTKEQKDFSVISELAVIPKQTDQFLHLLGKVSQNAEPIFIFDNIESFQVFDEEQKQWIWNQEKHIDVLELLHILQTNTSFPLIITGRYPIAEFPELFIRDLNTVPFGDFFKKCHQLQLNDLAGKMKTEAATGALKRNEEGKAASFEDLVKLLYKNFGGNYRALEFFDDLYVQKREAIFSTLSDLAALEKQLEEGEIKQEVLTQMSENLIFEQLLDYLDETDKDILQVLAQFNIPVLAMAIGMQRNNQNSLPSLEKCVKLTLVEAQKGIDGRTRFYTIPLIKELLKYKGIKKGLPVFAFDTKLAGDYHKYVYDNDLEEKWVIELSEAFEWYFLAKVKSEIAEVGDKLCHFYYKIQQFRLALFYGVRTEEISKEETYDPTLNSLGQIFQIFGDLPKALFYFEVCLNKVKQKGNKRSKGTLLNNISTLHKVQGDYDKALLYLEEALKIQQEIGNSEGEGAILNNISQVYDSQGDYDKALLYLNEALKIQQEIGASEGKGVSLNNIGVIYMIQGDYENALSYLKESLEIRQEIGDRQGESATLANMASIFTNSDYKKALRYLEMALKISQEIGDIAGIASTLTNIGGLLFEQEKYEETIPPLLSAYQIFEQIGSPEKKSPMSYLNAIYEKIGEERFNEIIQELNKKQQKNA